MFWCGNERDRLLQGRLTDGCLFSCRLGNRLFETHPECKDVFFLFRDVEDLERLRTNRELRAHGLRCVGTLHIHNTSIHQSMNEAASGSIVERVTHGAAEHIDMQHTEVKA